jgi:hypothetical protein
VRNVRRCRVEHRADWRVDVIQQIFDDDVMSTALGLIFLITVCWVVSPAVGNAIAVSALTPISPSINYAQDGAPGMVQFHILANHPEDMTVWVVNDAQNISSFDPQFIFEKEIAGQNPDVVRVELDPDGTRLEQMAAGNYTAYVQNGNGNHLEVVGFRVGGGDTTYVNFLGSAVTEVGKVRGQVQPTPTSTPIIPPPLPTVTIVPTSLPTVTITATPLPTVTITSQPTYTIEPTPTPTQCRCCKPHHPWWHFWEFEMECSE